MNKLRELKKFIDDPQSPRDPVAMMGWLRWCWKELDQVMMFANAAEENARMIQSHGTGAITRDIYDLVDKYDDASDIAKEDIKQQAKEKLDELHAKCGSTAHYVDMDGLVRFELLWDEEDEENQTEEPTGKSS